jgi:hypothetical protein
VTSFMNVVVSIIILFEGVPSTGEQLVFLCSVRCEMESSEMDHLHRMLIHNFSVFSHVRNVSHTLSTVVYFCLQ